LQLDQLRFELFVHRHVNVAIEFDEVGEQQQRAFEALDQVGLC